MWLPTRVYELLPTMYIIVGFTFLAGAAYISPYHELAPLYFVMGAVSILAGIVIRHLRLSYRRNLRSVLDELQA